MYKFTEFIILNENTDQNLTFLSAVKKVLSENPNGLTAVEIWEEIRNNNLVKTKARDPLNAVIYPLLQRHTDNISDKRSGSLHFTSFGNPRIFKILEEDDKLKTNTMKMTFINAAQLILKENDNRPMSANEIWDIIDDRDLVETKGTTPWTTLNATMLQYSDNSNVKNKYKKTIFTIVETNPAKFKLLNDKVILDIADDTDNQEFENKGTYSEDELRERLQLLLEEGKDEKGITRLSALMRHVMTLFLRILLSKNKTFSREEIRSELFNNGVGKTEGQSGQTLSNISQFLTKQNSDFLRQMISYDILQNKYSSGLHSDVGATKDNYKIIDEYRDLVKDIVSKETEKIILPFGKYPSSFDIEDELAKAQAQMELEDLPKPSKAFIHPEDDSVVDFKHFRGVQSQEETDSYVLNPFKQAICVLGKSGAGKSYTIDEILEKDSEQRPHKYEFIIPSASTTGLLSQFSPSAKGGSGGYLPSRLGKLIELAYKNPKNLYTVVFDECHKSNVIEMINDELLQAISTERNKNRFISLDDETAELYPSKVLDRRNNIIIPDNLGFIFISSNARIIAGNEDFFNRVDLVEITKEDRDLIKNINDLDKKRVTDTEKKYDLVSTIMAYTGRKN